MLIAESDGSGWEVDCVWGMYCVWIGEGVDSDCEGNMDDCCSGKKLY